jgi:hypothetical protein
MEEEIEIRKVAVEKTASIPGIAVTAILLAAALAAIIVVQKVANNPQPASHPAEQTTTR